MKFVIAALLCIYSVLPGLAQDIFEAARTGDIARMASLAKIKPDTLSSKNVHGFTPLIIAGYRNQLEAVKFLLEKGVNINENSPEGPVLLGACFKANAELVALLIRKGADVNAKNINGTTGLMYAAMSGSETVARLLINGGADKRLADLSGKKPQDYIAHDAPAALKELLSD